MRRSLQLVCFAAIARLPVPADLELRRIAEVDLIQEVRTDVERGKLRIRRRWTQPSSLDILNLVVRDQMLRDAVDGQRERLIRTRASELEAMHPKRQADLLS